MSCSFANSNEFVSGSDWCRENGNWSDVAASFEFADAFENSWDAFAFSVDEATAKFGDGELLPQRGSTQVGKLSWSVEINSFLVFFNQISEVSSLAGLLLLR